MDHTQMDHIQMPHGPHDHSQRTHEGEGLAARSEHHGMMAADFRKRFFVCLVLMAPILFLSPMIQMLLNIDFRFAGDSYLLFGLSTVLFFYGGKPFMSGARDEFRKRSPAMMMLITLAITTAYAYSVLTVFYLKGNDFFWELATLMVIMLLGHWIEMKSVLGASNALDELIKLMPETAHLILGNGEIADVPAKSLKVGDPVLIKPGEKVPIDGTVFEGSSSVDESMITGESVPVDKAMEDIIIGGSINGDGILKFRVNRVGADTFLSQVIKIVREAEASRSNTQRLAEIAAKWLFYIAVTAGAITFLFWIVLWKDLNFAIERAVTVIVISCPHALGLATPLVTAVSANIGAQRGLLIRDRAAFENARKINTMVFDKTGTLTEGRFGITDIDAVTVTKDELLTLAYSIEIHSEHPIAKGIMDEGRKQALERIEVSDYRNITGQGLEAKVGGRAIKIVGPAYMRSQSITFNEAVYEKLAQEGKTVIFIIENSLLLGSIALADMIRESAKGAVDDLSAMGVESILLTGDNARAASLVGAKLGIHEVVAEVLPQDKALKIEALQKAGKIVGMTGDGVNDAPSLARADLGIAIGAGTDIAIETADVILVRSDPSDVVIILKLSKATYRKMLQNLAWATGYNILAIPLAAGVLYNQGMIISPAIGALFMSLSTIIVSINANRLKIK